MAMFKDEGLALEWLGMNIDFDFSHFPFKYSISSILSRLAIR